MNWIWTIAMLLLIKSKKLKLITCGSRFHSLAEKNYAVCELECLGIQWQMSIISARNKFFDFNGSQTRFGLDSEWQSPEDHHQVVRVKSSRYLERSCWVIQFSNLKKLIKLMYSFRFWKHMKWTPPWRSSLMPQKRTKSIKNTRLPAGLNFGLPGCDFSNWYPVSITRIRSVPGN